jgi:hypothetical protein
MESIGKAYTNLKQNLQERSRHYLLAKDILEVELTSQCMIAMAGRLEIRKKAETVLRAHNLMKESTLKDATLGDQRQCILAKQLGGQIYLESILGMSYLSPTERLVLVEFMERFDRGDYPEFVREEDLEKSAGHASFHGHQTGLQRD